MARVSKAKPAAPSSKHPAHPLAQAKWQGSGLSDEQAAALHLTPLTGEETAALHKGFHPVASVKLPYFDFTGRETAFYRIRYLEKLPGFAAQAARPQKYAQEKGTLNEVYYPPLLSTPWEAIIKDPSQRIIITEGEFKAAAGCAAGFPTIGLGGVDVWRATKRGVELLPSLRQIQWAGRRVVVAFDSDAATNANVVRAQRRLVRELTALGALPSIVALPGGLEGAKVGLDDFIMAEGAVALGKLLDDAPGYPEADALWGMSEEVVYVRDPGIIFVQDSGQRMKPGDFVSHSYANRHYTELVPTKDGGVTAKKRALAKRWMEWEHRYELAGATYAPGCPAVHEGKWNTWPGWGCAPVKGDVAPWQWLMGFIFKDDLVARKWFEQWCAYHIQHPREKMYTSTVIWGTEHGTGKTLVGYSLMRIYGKNAAEIKNKDLHSSFNEWAESRQFVYGDEITGGDRRVDADYLKGLITQEQVRVNAKYVPTYYLPDYITYLFTTNHPDAIFMEDSDRRFFIHEVVGKPAERHYYTAYDAWIRSEEGPSALFDYLLNLDLTGFNPKAAAPVTVSKSSMVYDSKSEVGAFVADLKDDGKRLLRPLGQEAAEGCDLFTPAQLLRCYDPEGNKRVTAVGMGRELKRAGYRQLGGAGTVSTATGSQRLYAIRNMDYWQTVPVLDAAKHFDKFFGLDGGKF